MRFLVVLSFAALTLLTPIHDARAQGPAMPLPGAVVKDADGKLIAQVDSFDSGNFNPVVLFNFDDVPAPFYMQIQHGMFRSFKSVYFTGPDCTGDVYITEPSEQVGLDIIFQTSFVITGPDAVTGTYRVFRSTSPTPGQVSVNSRWVQGGNISLLGYCLENEAQQLTLAPAEEIIPNPLAGFHGPTVAYPERMLTIEGGTRLP